MSPLGLSSLTIFNDPPALVAPFWLAAITIRDDESGSVTTIT
jgi:hypothetical protein